MRPNNAVSITPEAFLKDHWQPAKVETVDAQRGSSGPPTAAYQRIGAGAAPALRFRVPVAPDERVTVDAAWRLGPQRRPESHGRGRRRERPCITFRVGHSRQLSAG